MASIVFDKYRDSWVLTSLGRTPSGIRMAIEPVRILPLGDSEGLGDVICRLLEEAEAQIPEPNYDDPDFKQTVFAKALGLKGYQQYLKAARCFYFRAEPSGILLEEWPRGRGGFLADNPVWRKSFPAGDFEGAVRFLINKTREAGGTSGTRSRRLGKPSGGAR